MANPYITPAAAEASAGGGDAFAEDTQIDVLAYQWGWEFSYGEASVTTEERLVLPADENVTFRLRTTDVIHAIYIPQLGGQHHHHADDERGDDDAAGEPAPLAEMSGPTQSEDATVAQEPVRVRVSMENRRPQPGRSTYRCAARQVVEFVFGVAV